MFDALRLECVVYRQHASGHREERADIKVEVNNRKGHHKWLSLDIGKGMSLKYTLLAGRWNNYPYNSTCKE